MVRNKPLAVMIMAAGQSSRFGSCKLISEIDGQPLLLRTINTARQLCPDDCWVITGAWHDQICQILSEQQPEQLAANLIRHRGWQAGLGSSIALGIRTLSRQYDAVMVVLADQVDLTTSGLQQLRQNFDGSNIVCAHYQNRNAVPAIFGRNSFPELITLTGDQGARALLQQQQIPVIACPMPDAAWDIDHPEDLQEYHQRHLLNSESKPI